MGGEPLRMARLGWVSVFVVLLIVVCGLLPMLTVWVLGLRFG